MNTLRILAVVAVALMSASAAAADGEHTRRLAAEVMVMLGDAGELTKTDLPEIRRQGIKSRLLGGLSSLRLLVRRARQERPTLPPMPSTLADLNPDISDLRSRLAHLSRLYPLDLGGILPPLDDPDALERARVIDQDNCAGCHRAGNPSDTDLSTPRPALDLFRQAVENGPELFAARMICGVRGDRLTGLENPLSDADISALIAFYSDPANAPSP